MTFESLFFSCGIVVLIIRVMRALHSASLAAVILSRREDPGTSGPRQRRARVRVM
jgi:hypothetical protein